MKPEIHSFLLESANSLADSYGYTLTDGDEAFAALKNKNALEEQIAIAVQHSNFTEDEAMQFSQLARNSATDFIQEATTSQDVKPYASFQISILKELFSRSIGRKLIGLETLASTSEKFGTFRSVLIDASGTRHYLNDINTETDVDEGWKETAITPDTKTDLFGSLSGEEANVANKLLDIKTSIVNVKVTNGAETVDVPVDIAFKEYGTVNEEVTAVFADGSTITERIYGIVDFKTGIVTLQSENDKVTEFTLNWRLSNVYSEINDMEIELEYEEDRVDIGDGTLINLSIPMNYLNDVKAYTTVDGLALAIEKISTAYSILQDRKILRTIAKVVDANPNNHVNWSYTLPSGVTRLEWNAGLLEAMNRAIAISDNATQFNSVSEFNLALNPIDASTLTSPTLLTSPSMSNPSVIGGSFNFNTTQLVSAAGQINLLSTKQVIKDNIYVVPKTTSEDERVISDFMYSNILITDNSYRNRKSPNIKNIAARERRELKIFEGQALTKINIV